MRKLIRLWTLFFVIFAVFFFSAAGFLGAQENQVTDTFDGTSLQEYERSQDVAIDDGVLSIQPGNFVFRIGKWSNPTITLKFKIGSPSSAIIQYHAGDKGSYGVHIIKMEVSEMVIFSDAEGQRQELAFTPLDDKLKEGWNDLKIDLSQDTHKVSLNGEEVLTAQDTKTLAPGSVGIVCEGENAIEIDELSIKASDGTVAGPEEGEGTAQDGEQPIDEGQEAAISQAEDGQVTGQQEDAASTGDDAGWKDFLGGLFVTGAPPIDMQTFLINLGLAALLAYILGLVYIHWGASLSNRRKFATNFILLTVTTTFIILVVRSSVALSLGLVGALSIVRFRAAIKEPEELAYLFLAIGLGIGLGDNQRIITLIAFAVAVVILGLLKLFRKSQADVNLHLNISMAYPNKVTLEDVRNALEPFCAKIKLLRFDQNDKTLEMSFLVEFRKVSDLNDARDSLEKLSSGINITFLDNKGIW